MIAGGDGRFLLKTEVVHLTKSDSTLSFGHIPHQRYGAAGAMFANGPILCGGENGALDYFNSCISFQNSKWSKSHSMRSKKGFPAGVLINSTTFWILGGIYHIADHQDTTEFIIQDQTNGVPGPRLPYGIDSMCAVKRSEKEIFVIGGMGSDSDLGKEVWIYDPQNEFARNRGPSLHTNRFGHSCSTMTDGEKIVIIVAGGEYAESLKTVEIYDPTDKTWHSGINKFLIRYKINLHRRSRH